jgi:GH25 family lysozyme M1 (1,4-beta-N-acetylmuramidase)
MDAHLLFADISNNNGGAAFHGHAYKSAGHKLIGLKASEGSGFIDPDHAAWAHAAHAAGLAVLHYHFARPEAGNPIGQARHFKEALGGHFIKGRDRLACDLETSLPKEGKAWLGEFVAELARLGVDVHDDLVGYTFLSYFQEAGGITIPSGAWWIAAWGRLMREREGLGNGQYLWAQQITNGVVGPEPHTFAGIRGHCDGSVINKRSLSLIEKALAGRRA